MRPRGLAAAAARAWRRATAPPRQDRLALGLRTVFIRPTRAGLAHAAGAGLVLLASINEQLALGHGLAFLMASVGVVALGRCVANLRGLVLVWTPPAPGHAGQPLALRPGLDDPEGRPRRGLRWRLDGAPAGQAGAEAACERAAGTAGATAVTLAWTPARRGLQPAPVLRLDSRHPLGLACAWVRWQPATPLRVWPAPEPDPPAPPDGGGPPSPAGEARPRASPGGVGELVDLRPARPGEPASRGLGRASARSLSAGGPAWLGLREDEAGGGPVQALRWEDTAAAGEDEARIARLTAWLLQAREAGRAWRLELPGEAPGPAEQGAAACAAALDRLAGWQPPGGPAA